MSWNKLDRMRLESDVLETEIHEQDSERWVRQHESRVWFHIAALAVVAVVLILSVYGAIEWFVTTGKPLFCGVFRFL